MTERCTQTRLDLRYFLLPLPTIQSHTWLRCPPRNHVPPPEEKVPGRGRHSTGRETEEPRPRINRRRTSGPWSLCYHRGVRNVLNLIPPFSWTRSSRVYLIFFIVSANESTPSTKSIWGTNFFFFFSRIGILGSEFYRFGLRKSRVVLSCIIFTMT